MLPAKLAHPAALWAARETPSISLVHSFLPLENLTPKQDPAHKMARDTTDIEEKLRQGQITEPDLILHPALTLVIDL